MTFISADVIIYCSKPQCSGESGNFEYTPGVANKQRQRRTPVPMLPDAAYSAKRPTEAQLHRSTAALAVKIGHTRIGIKT
jgi:hypothetical protein